MEHEDQQFLIASRVLNIGLRILKKSFQLVKKARIYVFIVFKTKKIITKAHTEKMIV